MAATIDDATTGVAAPSSGLTAPSADHASPQVWERRFRAMNTDVHVVIVGGEGERALDRAEESIRDREERWSRFLPDSEITLLNESPNRPVIVSADTYALVSKAIDAWHLTDGAFDPTIGSSMVAAGYDRSFNRLTPTSSSTPTTASTRAELRSQACRPASTPVGIELHATVRAIVLPAGVRLDLGGIAKGETADLVVAEILADGAAGCCVNIGGDLRVEGRAPDTRGWTVTIDCAGSDVTREVALQAGAVCTSTITKRRWLSAQGHQQHHLRDPNSGASLDTGVVSLSVLAARADQAEVLTKAAMSAGVDGVESVLTSRGATGIFVDRAGVVREVAGFGAFVLNRSS